MTRREQARATNRRWLLASFLHIPGGLFVGANGYPEVALLMFALCPLSVLFFGMNMMFRWDERNELGGASLEWADKHPDAADVLRRYKGWGPLSCRKRDQILKRWADREID